MGSAGLLYGSAWNLSRCIKPLAGSAQTLEVQSSPDSIPQKYCGLTEYYDGDRGILPESGKTLNVG